MIDDDRGGAAPAQMMDRVATRFHFDRRAWMDRFHFVREAWRIDATGIATRGRDGRFHFPGMTLETGEGNGFPCDDEMPPIEPARDRHTAMIGIYSGAIASRMRSTRDQRSIPMQPETGTPRPRGNRR
ncbi:MAG: hypothetical protein GYA24_03280 [Candidatus Lokiarchaeota archaeon]|nr:hypothetical protein [Candidatus Lokiarchaeota archaeon]